MSTGPRTETVVEERETGAVDESHKRASQEPKRAEFQSLRD